MAEQQKTDLRVRKTKSAIKETFKAMILEMDASDITIVELTERALIHRKTFYLHYTCIEDLFDDMLSELAQEYYRVIDRIPVNAPFTEVNRVFFTFMANQEPYVEKIVCSTTYREYSDKCFLSMLKHNRSRHNPYASFSQEEQNIINTFLGLNSINLYRTWVSDNKKVPLEELINLSGKLFMNGISSVLNNGSPV